MPANAYERFQRVLNYIDENSGEPLHLATLCQVAAFSKFHFHRQFSALFGVGVAHYVRLGNLKRAAYALAYREHSITRIGMDCGYRSPDAFARAFKKYFGQSPSDYRRQPQWHASFKTLMPLTQTRKIAMQKNHQLNDVTIANFPITRVAVLEHRGNPQHLGNSIRQFIAWRKANQLPPKHSATYNILYDDPAEVPAADYRFDLCATTDREVTENNFGVVSKTIPAGRCAVLRHIGSDDLLEATVSALYRIWLPQSGEELRDFPIFLRRVSVFPDVGEHAAITDVYLPIA